MACGISLSGLGLGRNHIFSDVSKNTQSIAAPKHNFGASIDFMKDVVTLIEKFRRGTTKIFEHRC